MLYMALADVRDGHTGDDILGASLCRSELGASQAPTESLMVNAKRRSLLERQLILDMRAGFMTEPFSDKTGRLSPSSLMMAYVRLLECRLSSN